MKARLLKDNASGINNLQQLAKQAQEAQDKMQEKLSFLKTKEYAASSGGGMVEVCMNGDMQVTKIDIKPDIIDLDDVQLLSDTIMAAVNEVIKKAEREKESVMGDISEQMNLPGMNLSGLF